MIPFWRDVLVDDLWIVGRFVQAYVETGTVSHYISGARVPDSHQKWSIHQLLTRASSKCPGTGEASFQTTGYLA